MSRRWICLVAIMAIIAGGGLSWAETAQEDVFATVNGVPISMHAYEEALLAFALEGGQTLGMRVTEQRIWEALVIAESMRRRMVIPPALVEARIAELKRQHQERTKGRISFEESLRVNDLTDPEKLHERVTIEQAADLMIRKDYRLADVELISPDQQQAWFKTLKRQVEIKTDELAANVFVQITWTNGNKLEIAREEVLDVIHKVASDQLKQAVQSRLIMEELVRQLAGEAGVTVDKKDMLTRLKEMKREWELQPENRGKSYEEAMKNSGADYMRKLADPRFRYEILLRKLVEPRVSEEDVRRFYEDKKDLLTGKEMQAAHIMAAAIDLRTGQPKDASGVKAAQEKIQKVVKKLKEGEDFAALAARYSDHPATAAKGGILPGYIPRDWPQSPEFAQALFSLEIGEVSGPVRTNMGWHVIKAVDARVKNPNAFDDPTFREGVRQIVIGQQMQVFLHEELAKAAVEVHLEDATAEEGGS